MAKFKEMYPEDWQSLVYRYKEHERHTPEGQPHPALHKKYPLRTLFVCKTGLFDLEKASKRDQKVLVDH